MVFEQMSDLGHEQVVFCRNDAVGLRAIIAIHSTALGPSLGGCRLYPYASDGAALNDVLRLSRGMTYKAAVAGLDLGGGKSVIMGDASIKNEGLFRALGRFIQSLGGRYIVAEDMNTNARDMDFIRQETRYVTGMGAHQGGSGEPGPATAWGTYHGIRACLEHVYGSPDVRGRSIAMQGVGSVGHALARYLADNGARVILTDVNLGRATDLARAIGAEVVDGEAFYGLDVDVLSPCAVGAVLNGRTIPKIRARIVAGCANNQLEVEAEDGEALRERGVVYAPDYVINAGGLIAMNAEWKRWGTSKAMEDAAGIFDTVKTVLRRAQQSNVTPMAMANRIAEERIDRVLAVRRVRVDETAFA
jgi:leucine dehydrogenase